MSLVIVISLCRAKHRRPIDRPTIPQGLWGRGPYGGGRNLFSKREQMGRDKRSQVETKTRLKRSLILSFVDNNEAWI